MLSPASPTVENEEAEPALAAKDGEAASSTLEPRTQESTDSKSCAGVSSDSTTAAAALAEAAPAAAEPAEPRGKAAKGRPSKRASSGTAPPPPVPKRKTKAAPQEPGAAGGQECKAPAKLPPVEKSVVFDDEAPSAAPVNAEERSREMARLQAELSAMREQHLQQKKRLGMALSERQVTRKALSSLLVQIAKSEDAEERDQVVSARWQLGSCRSAVALERKTGLWEGGYEADALVRSKDRIREDRQAIEKLRRQLTSQQKRAKAAGEEVPGNEEDDDLWEAREISNCRMSFLGREETALKEREARLEAERALHLKREQRLEAMERSNFRTYPLLAESRYQLLNMIGRGGFSEVFRAYDLESNRYCAVKIHELGKDMSDQQRQSYIRRAMREYEIQKTLNHPRVVTLQDCFPISTKAFGTVLELCEGETLDEHMKRCGALPEREARGIVIQILSGLRYMNTGGRRIIHFDLKPGNLFFSCGEVKIADFGLSKVVQESFGESIDLTSQGAGTYWYLPPECFVEAYQEDRPKISNKVDVWSTGVIFFELLFKRRPFGHGQSQEALLRSCMAASQPFALEIPAQPKATNEAKDFLKRVLTVDREKRPDVLEAFNDPYLRSRWRLGTLGTSGG